MTKPHAIFGAAYDQATSKIPDGAYKPFRGRVGWSIVHADRQDDPVAVLPDTTRLVSILLFATEDYFD